MSQKRRPAHKTKQKPPSKQIHLDFEREEVEQGEINFSLNENIETGYDYCVWKICVTKLIMPKLLDGTSARTLKIFCDLVAEGNSKQKLREFLYRSENEYDFNNLQFYPINKSHISSIAFKITDQLNNIVKFEKGYFHIAVEIEK